MDIDFILGNKKRKPTRKSSRKDPLINLFQGQGNPILGDRITKKQAKVFKGPSKNLFGDWDGDGVINALDCQPRNRNRHMAWKNVEEKDKVVHYIMDTPIDALPGHTRYKYKNIPINKLSKTEKYHSPFKIDEIKSSGEINTPIQVTNINQPKDIYEDEYHDEPEDGPTRNVPYSKEKGVRKIPLFKRGHYTIKDGHHRAIAAAERGDTHILAKVYDSKSLRKALRNPSSKVYRNPSNQEDEE